MTKMFRSIRSSIHILIAVSGLAACALDELDEGSVGAIDMAATNLVTSNPVYGPTYLTSKLRDQNNPYAILSVYAPRAADGTSAGQPYTLRRTNAVLFKWEAGPDGRVRFRVNKTTQTAAGALADDLCMTLAHVSVPGGTSAWSVAQQPCVSAGSTLDPNYQWFHWNPYPASDGSARIIWVGKLRGEPTSLCLDVPGSSTADGTPLQLYTCHSGINQRFVWGFGS